MNTLSFISANFVARNLGYHMSEGWMQGDKATQDYYRPLESFAERFDAMLAEVADMGFKAIDLWGAHLHPDWATREHLGIAKDRLKTHGLKVTSMAAWCASLAHVEGFSRVSSAIGSPIIAGGAPILREYRAEAVAILKNYGVKLALENHPEKNSQELLSQIADGAEGFVGAAPDTGWWATQNYSAAKALHELKEHILSFI
ncbi:MAG: hypothetical protein R2880_15720 [Deinococcales bacterium]